ncbi:MAG TPA: 50S ribosomal protein L18 [Clostridiales bacterium]|jgi:large subunit ribosomal protein L18|nr:50S ribosomal protein L18 [Clostridiales bacterium]
MIKLINKNAVRKARHRRMRNQLTGTTERPRLNVYRSLSHIYAQIIDDTVGTGVTLVSASTLDPEVKAQLEGKTKKEAAEITGEVLGKRAIEKGITKVVFDRGGYRYMGRVEALANGARKAGLDF